MCVQNAKPPDPELAYHLCKRALELEPSHPEAMCLDGRLSELQLDFETAEETFREALDLYPQQPSALHCLAKLLHDHKMDHDGADALYAEVIATEPSLGIAVFDHARLQVSSLMHPSWRKNSRRNQDSNFIKNSEFRIHR